MRRAYKFVVLLALTVLAVFQACTTEEVVGVVVQEVVIQPTSATVTLGDSLQLTAVVTDDRGEVLEGASPTWESSGETVALVDSVGMVWGLGAGTVDVFASFGSVVDTARITVTPPPVYGFVVLETSGSTVVSEAGGLDELTIVLLTQPTIDVVIDISSADSGEVVVDSATLRFTPSDWSSPRTIDVVGVADSVVDGPQSTDVTVSVAPGSDASYEGLAPKVVSVTTTDVEVAGFTVTETGGATRVDEGELVDTLLVVLDARPGSDVVVSLESGDEGEVVLDSGILTFTAANWDSTRTVTVAGVDDGEVDGDQSTPVTVSIVDGSSDDLWDEIPDQVVQVETVDGAVGLKISETDGGTSVDESGTEDTFMVVLTRAPSSDVVLAITVADDTEVDADRDELTFKPSDWSTPKSVKVKGVDDPSVDGPQVTAVTVEVLPESDPTFLGLTSQEVLVTTTDDDVAGFEVRETNGETRVDEGGSTDRIHVELIARPLSDVTLTVSSADIGEVVVEPTIVTFTPDDWERRLNIDVTGVDDELVDGSIYTDVTIAVDPASDPAFVGLPPQSVTVETEDDDEALFDVIETGGATIVTEGGAWDTFDVELLVRPDWTVTIHATSLDESEVTVSPASITISRFGGWREPRTFVVTGVDDEEVDGDQVSLILLEVEAPSFDDRYADAADRTLDVTTIDDDKPIDRLDPISGN